MSLMALQLPCFLVASGDKAVLIALCLEAQTKHQVSKQPDEDLSSLPAFKCSLLLQSGDAH